MTHVTGLATAQTTNTETVTVELIEANETPAVVIIRWPFKPSVIHPHRFPDVASTIARIFATAATQLAQIRGSGSCDGPCGSTTTCANCVVSKPIS